MWGCVVFVKDRLSLCSKERVQNTSMAEKEVKKEVVKKEYKKKSSMAENGACRQSFGFGQLYLYHLCSLHIAHCLDRF